MTAGGDDRYDVVVIGGGQAGLAAGYHLARAGLRFVILDERRRVGDNWRSRWASLRLYSPASADSLPGLRYPGRAFAWPTGREMGDYLEAYARRHALPVLSGVHVERVRRPDPSGPFLVEAGARRFHATQLIVATGAFQHPRVPELATRLDPSIRQLHSSEYRDPSELADGPVLVVGAGHSGGDIAYEAAMAGHPTTLSGRSHGQLPFPLESRRALLVLPLMFALAGRALTLGTPIGRRMAPRVRDGGGPLLRVRREDLARAGVTWVEGRTVDARDGLPVLDDGRVVEVANVVWCTGFRPDFSWIEPRVTDDAGWPIQRRGVVPTQPGLYFLGLPFLYSFASMLVAGAGRDARYVVDRVVEAAGARRDGTRPVGQVVSAS